MGNRGQSAKVLDVQKFLLYRGAPLAYFSGSWNTAVKST